MLLGERRRLPTLEADICECQWRPVETLARKPEGSDDCCRREVRNVHLPGRVPAHAKNFLLLTKSTPGLM